MEHRSALKRNKMLMCATVWMNVQNAMLCERSQVQNSTSGIIPFCDMPVRQTDGDTQQIGDGPEVGRKKTLMPNRQRLGVEERSTMWIRVMATPPSKFSKTHWMAHLQSTTFMGYKTDFDKTDFKKIL